MRFLTFVGRSQYLRQFMAGVLALNPARVVLGPEGIDGPYVHTFQARLTDDPDSVLVVAEGTLDFRTFASVQDVAKAAACGDLP